jgi:hypothetical protein
LLMPKAPVKSGLFGWRYGDRRGLFKRHDYDVEIAGESPPAHYVSDLGNLGADQAQSGWQATGWDVDARTVSRIDRSQRD